MPATDEPLPAAPLERFLVEWTYGEVGPQIGDALLPSDAPILVLAAPPPDAPGLRSDAPAAAPVGEIVEAEVFVSGDPGLLYRVTIEPSDAAVRLLSPADHRVPGNTTLRIRFTRALAGKGRVNVRASPDPGIP
ncbi:MAG: hypothetical protein ACYTAF_04200 [Planctomycetota bacterium]